MTFAVLGILYFARYTTIKSGSDEILFFNPFTIDEVGFRDNYETAIAYIKKGDNSTARKYFEKAIKYRGSHNERVRENIYSDGNGLWEYKQDKLLKFSHCYENLGMLDSAMTCLEPALYNFERYHFPTEDQFFRIAIEKYGKDEVINELVLALAHIQEIDCFMCMDYYIEFKGIKVGLDINDIEVDKNELFEKLKKKYCDQQSI
ncbi:hypothetical protein [Croceimicrobium hydrocarbonivorans]|uniref:Tetratricopeptide repeat protein n=1 Tax=Croceimicrobium hydrocarbonivorans TaxID=2761580 RepID=A0A7H0VHA9_9FLAO|nr:hypothetical protein [Croceimicrobium hydrocarbonivorans]QNR25107.1 hypothetical protein H4K34_04520 [Croceimicrobium hydrocarbonivorans]